MPGSLARVGSLGSLRYWPVMRPVLLSRPAGLNTAVSETDTFDMKWSGFQPRSNTLRIAWAANLGVAAVSSVSQPAACRVTSWESTVGSVTSYDAVLITNLSY